MAKAKKKSRKKVTVKLLARIHAGKVTEAYRIMEELIKKHHAHLAEAKIAIAWRFGWNANADGQLKLGQAKKGSDLDRELHEHDFVILLNHEAWNQGGLNEKQKIALIDHELCHCEVAMDSNGETKFDEQGRTCYRIRKHDIEEFKDVVSRHGVYTRELEEFARAGINDSKRNMLPAMEKPADADGKSGNSANDLDDDIFSNDDFESNGEGDDDDDEGFIPVAPIRSKGKAKKKAIAKAK